MTNVISSALSIGSRNMIKVFISVNAVMNSSIVIFIGFKIYVNNILSFPSLRRTCCWTGSTGSTGTTETRPPRRPTTGTSSTRTGCWGSRASDRSVLSCRRKAIGVCVLVYVRVHLCICLIVYLRVCMYVRVQLLLFKLAKN